MKNACRLLLLVLLLLSFSLVSAFALPDSFTGTVIEVLEGDLLKVLYRGKLVDIRLSFIDCPERGQTYGKEAMEFTKTMAHTGPVRVDVNSVNSVGQVSAEVTMMDAGFNINRELVKAGFAWWQGKHSDDKSYKDLENIARKMKLGLWKGENPMPPWEFKDKAHGH